MSKCYYCKYPTRWVVDNDCDVPYDACGKHLNRAVTEAQKDNPDKCPMVQSIKNYEAYMSKESEGVE